MSKAQGSGEWQQLILALLDIEPHLFVLRRVGINVFKRPLTQSEYKALYRAAKLLQGQKKCLLALDKDPTGRLALIVRKPDATNPDGTPIQSVERVTNVTGSTYSGSLRHMAKLLGKSHTTVWRDLKAKSEGKNPGFDRFIKDNFNGDVEGWKMGREVFHAAIAEPEKYQDIADYMNTTSDYAGAYKRLEQRRKEQPT